MKPIQVAVLAFVVTCVLGRAAGAGEKPLVLEPYKVEARPFGFLGVKHATVSLNPWKLVVGMNSVRFLQIDELEAGSPGIAAGVQPGDRIVSIDGVPVSKIGLLKLRRMNRELEVGQKLQIEILRPSDGSKRVLEVIVPPRVKQRNQQITTDNSRALPLRG